MKKIKQTATTLALTLALSLSGCTALQNADIDRLELPITYGTLKVIDRDNDISSEDVVEAMNKLDSHLQADMDDESIAANRLREEALEIIGYDRLDAADQFLVAALLDDIERSIRQDSDSFEGSLQVRIKLSELVEYARRAALMHGG